MKRWFLLLALLTAIVPLTAQSPPAVKAVDWKRLEPEMLEHYRSLVRIDSTAGRETLVVDYLKKVLEAEGIPTKVFALDPARCHVFLCGHPGMIDEMEALLQPRGFKHGPGGNLHFERYW